MLKQLLQFRTLLIALLVMAGVGNGWAEETTVTASKISSSSATWTGTANESWKVSVVGGATNQNVTNSYAQVGTKNSPSTSITFSTSGITGTITSIVVDCAAYEGRATISATVDGSAFGDQQQTVPTWSNSSGSGVTFSGNASGSIVITMTNGTGGRAMYIKSIKVTYTPSAALEKTDPTITFNAGSVRVGRTLDLSTLFSSNSTGDVTYSISEGDTYASLSGSVLTGKEVGTVTVKAEQAETTTYNAGEATATITVNPYVQPTSVTANMNNNVFGVSTGNNADEQSYTVDRVTVVAGCLSSATSKTYYDSNHVRFYQHSYLKLTAPTGYNITRVVFKADGDWKGQISVNDGEYNNNSKTWTGGSSQLVFSFAAQNRIASASITLEAIKSASDLALTSNSSVELYITSANIHPTSTITYTTSSTGTVTFESNDTSVATVSDDGVIMAQGEGAATITISQEADDTYKAGEQTVTVNVTDNRSAVVTDIDLPAVQKTLSVGDLDYFAPTATVNEGFTGGTVSYSFVTSDASVVNVTGTTFSAEAPGTATITITATPTGGNADNYKPATQDVQVTVMGETTLQLSKSSVNTTYGTNATVDATVPIGYDGTLTAESSNTSIANASVEGTTITITPVAVGTATITVTAPETSTFSGEATETINVTVAAPEGQTTAAPSTINVFNETFANSTGTAGWSGNSASGTIAFDNEGWLSHKGNGNGGSARFGTSSEQGYAITPALGKAGNLTLSFKAGAWEGDKTTDGLILSIEEGEGTLGTSTFTLVDSKWDSYETTIKGATAATKIKFSAAQSSKNRFFLDDVVVTKPGVALTAKFNASGYATYCSEYPLNFSTADDYSAWQVTGVGGNAITFEKVTGSVKGGTGLLLMGEASSSVTLASVDSETELTTNLLKGTLAPTYVKANEYYGLSGQQFLKVNTGTVKAGKALLPASVVDNAGNVRTLSLVFVDPTTGIAETKTMTNEDAIYNLAGQRISKAQRGVNIIGGKKVLVK